MCSNCYHISGREKKPWNCEHLDKHNYAKGMCQACYQQKYLKRKEYSEHSSKIMTKEDQIEFSKYYTLG